jgi:hypothetical protein
MGYSRRRSRRRKEVPWAGWGKISPKGYERTVMLRDCGRKCFLGPGKSFPVCAKGTCRINTKGAYAAYIRAREWGKKPSSYHGEARPTMRQRTYKDVARKAVRILRRRGYNPGSGSARRSRSYGRSYSRRRRSYGGMRRCPKGTHRRLIGQVRRGRKIIKHGHFSRKCTKRRGRSRGHRSYGRRSHRRRSYGRRSYRRR